MRTVCWLFLLLSVLGGCGKSTVTDAEAKAIADRRYQVHAKMLGSQIAAVPQPTVQSRSSDTVFVYIEPTTKKKITVIVERSGEVADTVEPL